MKPIVLSIFVVFLILTVDSANIHKVHKAVNVKIEENPGDVNDDENEFEWPAPETIHNFDVPEVFRQGGFNTVDNEEPTPAPHRGKSKHRSHSH